jgi:hypothetical protein
MKKQDKRILLNIDEELKKVFTKKCDDNHMKISARIKYLIRLDVEGKIIIKNENM